MQSCEYVLVHSIIAKFVPINLDVCVLKCELCVIAIVFVLCVDRVECLV